MQQLADQSQPDTTSVSASSHTVRAPLDLQRDALRDLISLASECARREAEIYDDFTRSRDALADKFASTRTAAEARFHTQSEELKLKHQADLDAIERLHEKQINALKSQHKQVCAGIQWDYSAAEKNTKSSHDEAKLLIETGLDAAHNRAQQQKESLKKDIANHLEAIENTFKKTAQVISRYSLIPPGIEPDKAKPQITPGVAAQKVMIDELANADKHLQSVGKLALPNFMAGILPFIVSLAICGAAGIVAQFVKGGSTVHIKTVGIAVGAAVAVEIIGYILLWRSAKKQLFKASLPVIDALSQSHAASQIFADAQRAEIQSAYEFARHKGQAELDRVKQRTLQTIKSLQEKRNARLSTAQAELEQAISRADAEKATRMESQATAANAEMDELQRAHHTEMESLQRQFEQGNAANEAKRQKAWNELENRLQTGLAQIKAPTIGNPGSANLGADVGSDWNHWEAPLDFPDLMPFGRLSVNLKQIVDTDSTGVQVQLQFPPEFTVPASLAFPHGASLAVLHERGGRRDAIEFLRVVILRILTCLPPGRARFTLIDPVGLGQSFAGFMRLADYDDALVNGRIWTQPDQIEQRLSHMTEHMETVIQKYLRNEFPTIDDYNAQAGELAEPYRFFGHCRFSLGFRARCTATARRHRGHWSSLRCLCAAFLRTSAVG